MNAVRWMAGLALLASSANATTTPVVLQPSSKWYVDFQDKMCVMARTFGAGNAAVTIAFRPWPLGGDAELVLIGWGHAPDGGEIADGTVTIGKLPPDRKHYLFWRNARTGKSMTSINLKQEQLDGLNDGDAIIVRTGGRTIAFAPLGLARAEKVIGDCQDDLVKSWGIDPAERHAVVTPAESSVGSSWISAGDYPVSAIRSGSIGDTTILYAIGTDGRVSDCRIVGPSGSPELDAAACAAITKRGRFSPALDAAEKPIVSHRSQHINWRMPN